MSAEVREHYLALRALSERLGLLQDCECEKRFYDACGCIHGSCPWCEDTFKRLPHLDEVLAEKDGLDMLWLEYGNWCASRGDGSDEVGTYGHQTPLEAALRLLEAVRQ